MYHMTSALSHYRRFVPEIVPLWLKNRNQRVHTGGLMRETSGLIHGVIQALRKRWAYLWELIRGGGRVIEEKYSK